MPCECGSPVVIIGQDGQCRCKGCGKDRTIEFLPPALVKFEKEKKEMKQGRW